jgi:hypothetical protein
VQSYGAAYRGAGLTAGLAVLYADVQQVVDDPTAVEDAHKLVARRLHGADAGQHDATDGSSQQMSSQANLIDVTISFGGYDDELAGLSRWLASR